MNPGSRIRDYMGRGGGGPGSQGAPRPGYRDITSLPAVFHPPRLQRTHTAHDKGYGSVAPCVRDEVHLLERETREREGRELPHISHASHRPRGPIGQTMGM
jgi:hypothetical protein